LAITAADRWQGCGIGTLLLSRLLQCAADAGVTPIEGDVHATNDAMLRLGRKL